MSELDRTRKSIFRRKRFWLALAYVSLLVWSGIYRYNTPESPVPKGKLAVQVNTVSGEAILDRKIRLTYKEFAPVGEAAGEYPVILVHGSPGDAENFDRIAKVLRDRRLIAVDLPGFGDSERLIPDYSITAHARYVLELLDQLKIGKAHFVGFSLGGGVIAHIADMRPGIVESMAFISSIGVQEHELFGDYYVNHLVHGLQLTFFWALYNLTPHFGVFDGMMMSYAWNFYQTDQRPLRKILLNIRQPFLILHGIDDPLVPVEAAREHARIIPQSEYHELDDDHFFVFLRPEAASKPLASFWNRAEAGKAETRSTAHEERVAAASLPFRPMVIEARGVTAFTFFLLLAGIAFVNEDLGFIIGGIFAAQGRFGVTFAVIACLFGAFLAIWFFQVLGRYRGSSIKEFRVFRALFGGGEIDAALARIARKRLSSVFLNRGSYGFRSSFYFLAGALRSRFWAFLLGAKVAAVIWGMLITGSVYLFAETLIRSSFISLNNTDGLIIASVAAYLVLTPLVRRLLRLND